MLLVPLVLLLCLLIAGRVIRTEDLQIQQRQRQQQTPTDINHGTNIASTRSAAAQLFLT